MIQSGEGEYKGKWGWPGGKIQFGEVPSTSLIREVKEETGYITGELELFRIYGSEPLQGLWVVSHAYRGVISCGDRTEPDGDEILDIRWMSHDEIRGLHKDKIRTSDTLQVFEDSLTRKSVDIIDLERIISGS